jgi:GAF domain-containing protein
MGINTSTFLQQEINRLKTENQALKEELFALREFVTILHDLRRANEQISSDEELLPLLEDILVKALKLLNSPDGSLILLDDETNELVFVVVHGTIGQDLLGYRIPADEGIAGWVIQNASPALVRDVRRDMRFSHLIDETFKFKTQSIAAAPLMGDGKMYGLVEVLNQPGDMPFSETDVALLGLLCWVAGEALAAIERKNPEPL